MYPYLKNYFALRQIGEDVFYLMDSQSGDFYELDSVQLFALQKADGMTAVQDISNYVDKDVDDVSAFFKEQSDEGVVEFYESPRAGLNPPHYRKSESPHLSDALIEVTGKCNLACRHCFNSGFNTEEALGREMSADDIKKLISELDDLNCRRLQLSGGEAIMRPDLWEIVKAIEDHRIFLDVISTNATTISEENVQKLIDRFKYHGALYISMDGLTAPTYEALRGEGVFPVFKKSLDSLLAGGCRVFLNTMAFKDNLDELLEMYDWIVKQPSILGWRIGLPKVLGRYTENHEHLEVEFEQVIEIFKTLLERWMVDRPDLRLELSDFFRTDSLKIGLEDHLASDNPCKYAITNCTIKPDGEVVFCASLEICKEAVLGNAVSQGLKEVWYGQKHMEFRSLKISELPECVDCRYRRICGGGCRSNALLSYGDFKGRDPRSCVAMQMLENQILDCLPVDYREHVYSLIDKGVAFTPASGYRKYI